MKNMTNRDVLQYDPNTVGFLREIANGRRNSEVVHIGEQEILISIANMFGISGPEPETLQEKVNKQRILGPDIVSNKIKPQKLSCFGLS